MSLLIDEELKQWKSDFVLSSFPFEIAEAILQIPLSFSHTEDKIVWHHETNGLYTVKSGYRFLCQQEGGLEDDLPEHVEEDRLALRLNWKADVPPKVRIFGWRLFHGILPVMDTLRSRGMDIATLCFRCQQASETVAHAIRECPCAAAVWRIVEDRFHLRQQGIDYTGKSNLDWLDLSLLTAWAIWGSRNNSLFNEENKDPTCVAEFAWNYLHEHKTSKGATKVTGMTAVNRWTAPKHGFIKINFDGALNKDSRLSGFGAVARDSEGQVLGALAGKEWYVAMPEVAEGLAVRRALIWAREMGFSRIIVEGDSLSLINKLKGTGMDFSPIGHLVDDSKQLRKDFSHCLFSHVKRDGNHVAHKLARLGLVLDNDSYWMEELPQGIRNDVIDDTSIS